MRSALLLAVLFVFAGCPATCQSPGPTTVDGGPGPSTTFKNCSTQALETAAQGILGAVTQAIATADYVAALAGLVTQYGAAEVACAVELAVGELQQRVDATPSAQAVDPVLLTQIANGKAWLAAHGAK
jgi:hypothetical protein